HDHAYVNAPPDGILESLHQVLIRKEERVPHPQPQLAAVDKGPVHVGYGALTILRAGIQSQDTGLASHVVRSRDSLDVPRPSSVEGASYLCNSRPFNFYNALKPRFIDWSAEERIYKIETADERHLIVRDDDLAMRPTKAPMWVPYGERVVYPQINSALPKPIAR